MTVQRVLLAAGLGAASLTTVAACNGSASDSVDPSSSSHSSATVSQMSPSDIASENAVAAMQRYFTVRNELRQDPRQDVGKLETVAVSGELLAQQNLIRRERKDSLRQTGATKISELLVQSIDLDNSDPKAGKVPTVQIDVCVNVSNVDIVDTNGKSTIGADRPDTGWIRYVVANYEWKSDPVGAWLVASSSDLEREPCGVS